MGSGVKVHKTLFDFGMNIEEPNVWDVFPDIDLRVYDNKNRYFATWDIGSCIGHINIETGLIYWPKPLNPEFHWDFSPRFVADSVDTLWRDH